MRAPIVALLSVCLIAAPACNRKPGQADTDAVVMGAGQPCKSETECPAGYWCLHQQCVAKPSSQTGGDTGQPGLAVSPTNLNFGPVAPGSSRTLPLVLTNPGDQVVTLTDVALIPKSAPFRVESLGYGPFWLRPGRDREILVTFAPSAVGAQTATLTIQTATLSQQVGLSGN